MAENTAKFYPNALCFENKRELELSHNWFDSNYKNFIVNIDAC